MTDNKATEDLLASLHGALADKMQAMLNGDTTAAELSVIRQFLKDNGINADGTANKTLKTLSADLPDDLDNVTPLYGG